ncbi:MAG: class I SAM-dependent methyltransferase [Mesorhizobium sp.]|nr:class I SAM-dependent methyltransferase [Mesorhizobium sp.]
MWQDEVDGIRAILRRIGHSSQTSDKFQDDVLRFIAENHASGGSIIEIGCYHGGFTAQLACLARTFGLQFDVIDIDRANLKMAAHAVAMNGLASHARFHKMDFAKFVRRSRNPARPVLVFVDGDHRYQGVVADIKAIRSMAQRPFACAFHDFSLRYADGPLTIVRVDRAIFDMFGADVALTPVGEIAGQGATLRTVPEADRHFHQPGQPEGVIVRLESLSDIRG